MPPSACFSVIHSQKPVTVKASVNVSHTMFSRRDGVLRPHCSPCGHGVAGRGGKNEKTREGGSRSGGVEEKFHSMEPAFHTMEEKFQEPGNRSGFMKLGMNDALRPRCSQRSYTRVGVNVPPPYCSSPAAGESRQTSKTRSCLRQCCQAGSLASSATRATTAPRSSSRFWPIA